MNFSTPGCSFDQDYQLKCDVLEKRIGRVSVVGSIEHCQRKPELNLDIKTERNGRRLLSFIAGNPPEIRRIGHRLYPLDFRVNFGESDTGGYKLKISVETVKTGKTQHLTDQTFPSIPRCAQASRMQSQTLISFGLISLFASLVLLTVLLAVFVVVHRRRRPGTLSRKHTNDRQESVTFIRVPPPLPGSKQSQQAAGGTFGGKRKTFLGTLSASYLSALRPPAEETSRACHKPRFTDNAMWPVESLGDHEAVQPPPPNDAEDPIDVRCLNRENKAIQSSLLSLDTGVGLTTSTNGETTTTATTSTGPGSSSSSSDSCPPPGVVGAGQFSSFKGTSSSSDGSWGDGGSSPLDRRHPLHAIIESDSL